MRLVKDRLNDLSLPMSLMLDLGHKEYCKYNNHYSEQKDPQKNKPERNKCPYVGQVMDKSSGEKFLITNFRHKRSGNGVCGSPTIVQELFGRKLSCSTEIILVKPFGELQYFALLGNIKDREQLSHSSEEYNQALEEVFNQLKCAV